MPLTTIDPKVALIIVDLQKGITGLPTVDPIEGVIARSRALADAFRAHRLPVVLVNVVAGAPARRGGPRRRAACPTICPPISRTSSRSSIRSRTTSA